MSFFNLDDLFPDDKPKKKGSKKEPTIAQEYLQTGKNMYEMGKNIKNSPLAHFIKKKYDEHKYNKLLKGWDSTKIELGSAPLGWLKPTKKELEQLKGDSRIRYY